MLLLMFTALTILTITYSDFNQSTQEQMNSEQQRSQEKITLTTLTVDQQAKITTLTVENQGTIEVEIRALYLRENGITTFLTDPSTPPVQADTSIKPGTSKTINITCMDLKLTPTTRLIAATERGVKTIDIQPPITFETSGTRFDYNSSRLYVGPLILEFTSFKQQQTSNGILNPNLWLPGWSVPKGTQVAWKITVIDNDTQRRPITINKFSSFTITTVDGSPQNPLTWFLEPTDKTNLIQKLEFDQYSDITFIWTTAGGTKPQSVYTQTTTCMVFLTFFGVYNNSDGTTSPYAQTVPFEAAIMIT